MDGLLVLFGSNVQTDHTWSLKDGAPTGGLCDTCTVTVPDQKVISAILVLSLSLTKR